MFSRKQLENSKYFLQAIDQNLHIPISYVYKERTVEGLSKDKEVINEVREC